MGLVVNSIIDHIQSFMWSDGLGAGLYMCRFVSGNGTQRSHVSGPCDQWLALCQWWNQSRFAPSQWETPLLCNHVSHWLGASLESAILVCVHHVHWQNQLGVVHWRNVFMVFVWVVCQLKTIWGRDKMAAISVSLRQYEAETKWLPFLSA